VDSPLTSDGTVDIHAKIYKVCMMDIPINIYQRHIINKDFNNLKLKVMALRDSPLSWLSL
jgi:hypothetical protein